MAKQHKRQGSKRKPITSHSLFPAVVALWFAALFGLGSLAVRVSLIESLVIKSRIDLLVPAAAPPLGLTARLLIALAMSALGSVLGVVLAHRITRPRPEQRARKGEDDAAEVRARDLDSDIQTRCPISVHDELGADEGNGVLLGRRRSALAIEPDEDEFVPPDMAPLPGGAPQILDIAGMELASPARPAAAPLHLDHFAEVAIPVALPSHPAASPQPHGETEAHADMAALAGRQVFGQTAPAAAPEPRQIFGAPIGERRVSPDFIHTPGFKPSGFEIEDHPPLFGARISAEAQPAVPQTAQPVAPTPQEPIPPRMAGLTEPVSTASAPITGLGMTDLAVRLQQSMLRRRTERAAAPTVEPISPAVAMPAALRPFELDGIDDDDDDKLLASLLPPRTLVPPPVEVPARGAPPAFAPDIIAASVEAMEEPAEADLVEPGEEAFGSLLDLGAARFVRIAEPEPEVETTEPVVIFPGQAAAMTAPLAAPEPHAETMPFRRFGMPPAPPEHGQPVAAASSPLADPSQADKALRAALANLQGMSGVGRSG